MSLDLVKMLQSAAIGMMDGSVLGPKEGYEQASSITFGMTLNIIADLLDGAAEALSEENGILRTLFADAVSVVEDAALAARLREASEAGGPSLRVSALYEENQQLRALLIELHAQVEALEAPQARGIDERIWRELLRSTERRRVALGPF